MSSHASYQSHRLLPCGIDDVLGLLGCFKEHERRAKDALARVFVQVDTTAFEPIHQDQSDFFLSWVCDERLKVSNQVFAQYLELGDAVLLQDCP
jgi:hypothetical protein